MRPFASCNEAFSLTFSTLTTDNPRLQSAATQPTKKTSQIKIKKPTPHHRDPKERISSNSSKSQKNTIPR